MVGALATDLGIDGVQFADCGGSPLSDVVWDLSIETPPGRAGGPDERLRPKSVVVLRYVLECLELLRVVAAEDLPPLLRD